MTSPRAVAFCVLMVIGAILVSVQIGLKAEGLEERVQSLRDAQEIERDRIHVLRASYAYLTAAEQLRPLAARHLELVPVRGDRMVSVEDLPLRTPLPPGAAPEPVPGVPKLPVPPSAKAIPQPPLSNVAPPAGQRRLQEAQPVTPPWLKAQQTPVLQPASLANQKR